MKVSLTVAAPSTTGMAAAIQRAADSQLTGLTLAHGLGHDAMTLCAASGHLVPPGSPLALAVFVVPTYPRHPAALAQQAISTQAACGGRFVLGVGPSHQAVVGDMLGLPYTSPARHTEEYLAVLLPLLRGQPVSFAGEHFRVEVTLDHPVRDAPQVLVGALGPAMLRVAGAAADGTVLSLVGPRTVAEHVLPRIRAAADAAGRPQPEVVARVAVSLTADTAAARELVNGRYALHSRLPSYQATLQREGASEPADVAVIGDEAAVIAGLHRLADAGVTWIDASPVGTAAEIRRTIELLAGWRGTR